MDPYEVLGLKSGTTPAQIKARYRQLAKMYHPDKNRGDPTAEWIFKRVQAAYDVLQRDPKPTRVRLFFVGGPERSRRGCERHGKSYLTRRRRGEEGDGGGSLTGGAIPSA